MAKADPNQSEIVASEAVSFASSIHPLSGVWANPSTAPQFDPARQSCCGAPTAIRSPAAVEKPK
jgi:hypothetical protein